MDWLNEYHRKTREVTGQALKEQGKMEALDWLLRETRPLQYMNCVERNPENEYLKKKKLSEN